MKNSAYLLLLVTLFFSAAEAFAQNCPREVVYRREIRNQPLSDWNRFVDAVKKLHSMPGKDGGSRYDEMAKIHTDYFDQVHGNAMYFPFNRAYLLEFERELQKIDPAVVLPYWNWSVDIQALERSPIFYPEYMGGNDELDGLLVMGRLGKWMVSHPEPHRIRRKFNNGTKISGFNIFFQIGPDVSAPYLNEMGEIFRTSVSYDAFRRNIEFGPAGGVHEGIGGDMSMKWAANDPIFWVHMVFVDKLWADWQRLNPDRLKVGVFNGGYGGTNMNPDTVILGLKSSYKVSGVLDTRNLCYDYLP